MRFLLLSDIHGNRFGLEAVLSDAQNQYDALICLGDIVGYGAHPNECCDWLQAHSAQCLSGNHDAAALGLIDLEWFNDTAATAATWTREQLTPENTAWLKSLPAQKSWPEYSFEAVHGRLRDPWKEYIIDPLFAEPTLLLMEYPLCFFGHTHVAVCYSCPRESTDHVSILDLEETMLKHGGLIEMDDERKYLVNPGSCGQPRDRNPQARYALYDAERKQIEVRAVDYDIQAARRAIYDAKLPTSLGDRLEKGR